MPLPVSHIIPELLTALKSNDVLLSAPPGAGKSTAIPLALLEANVGRILLLQPRRVVVKQLADYLASQLGEKVGETVGYRIKGENVVGKHTKLEVITDGILTRRLQHDPELTHVDIVLFDEFHERSLYTDFGLALTIEAQQILREDLRIVVMSATLDVSPLQRLLPQAKVLSSQGRRFPVKEVYTGTCQLQYLSQTIAKQVVEAIRAHHGDILVFLPTVAHINQASAALSNVESEHITVHKLHGSLPIAQQQLAIKKDADGRRKVILATNLAETSLTIDGVRIVIDSGRQQVASFHPGNQMTELSISMISQASAEQRKGRAGRLETGICYRLWSREHHTRLSEFTQPAITTQDVLPLVLHAAAWGTPLLQLPLLNTPSEAQLNCANQALLHSKLIKSDFQITQLGKQALSISAHPRFASMLLRCKKELDDEHLLAGCWVTAVAEESPKAQSCILSELGEQTDTPAYQRIVHQAKRYAKQLELRVGHNAFSTITGEQLALVTALALPDWVAKLGDKGRYKLAMGTGAKVAPNNALSDRWLAILIGQRKDSEMMIRLAQPIDLEQLRTYLPEQFSCSQQVVYDPINDAIKAQEHQYFGQINVLTKPLSRINSKALVSFWKQWLGNKSRAQWPIFSAMQPALYRIAMAKRLNLPCEHYTQTEEWPELNSDWLLQSPPLLNGLKKCYSVAQLKQLDWCSLITQTLPWYQQQQLERLLPLQLTLRSGFKRRLRYESAERVVLSVRMQDMYGCNQPLLIADSRQTVVVELLSPANRPIQTTDDLARFWQGSYAEVRKEMKGRYPKHNWPEDPTTV